MHNANSKQIGGDHYKRTYEHWDFAADMHMRGLEYAATKYISRFVYKGGLEDLRKAEHYIDKIVELHKANKYTTAQSVLVHYEVDVLEQSSIMYKYTNAQKLGHAQAEAVRALATWADWHDLCYARTRVQILCDAVEREPGLIERLRAAHFRDDAPQTEPPATPDSCGKTTT